MVNNSSIRSHRLLGAMIAILIGSIVGLQPATAAQECTTRFYLSPILDWQTSNARPLIYDLSFRGNGELHKGIEGSEWFFSPYDPATGAPIVPWVFVVQQAYNHHHFLRSKDLGVLPDIPLNTVLSDLNAKTLEEVRTVLVRFGIDTSILETGTYYEDIIWHIGRSLVGPDFFIFIPGYDVPCWDNTR